MALTDKLTAIADAIRDKTGKTDGLTLDAMPAEIEGIESGGMPEIYTSEHYGLPYFKNHIIPDRETGHKAHFQSAYEGAIFMETVYVGKNISCGPCMFKGCSALVEATVAGKANNEMFWNDRALKKCIFTETGIIGDAWCFDNCSALETVIIYGERVMENPANNTFSGATNFTNSNGIGRIYVPRSQLEAYKIATNWTAFADKFLAIEDYLDIVGV
jgi:hypothetical protein